MDDDNLVSKKENSIDDLINSAKKRGKVKISSEEVEEKLKSKIKELESKKKEEAAMQEAANLGYDHISLKGFPIIPEALI